MKIANMVKLDTAAFFRVDWVSLVGMAKIVKIMKMVNAAALRVGLVLSPGGNCKNRETCVLAREFEEYPCWKS